MTINSIGRVVLQHQRREAWSWHDIAFQSYYTDIPTACQMPMEFLLPASKPYAYVLWTNLVLANS